MSDSTMRMSTAEMDRFPWGGFHEYSQSHPEILPDFTSVADIIVGSFEAEARQLGGAAVLAWGPSNMGKSTTLVPTVERAFRDMGYETIPRTDYGSAVMLLERGGVPQSDKGLVMVLDELCWPGETVQERTEDLAQSVSMLNVLGVACVDARSHHFVKNQFDKKDPDLVGRALFRVTGVPVTNFDIDLENATPSPAAVEELLKILGMSDALVQRFVADSLLRTVGLLKDLTKVVVCERMHSSPLLTDGDEIIDAAALSELIKMLPVDNWADPCYGFRSLQRLESYILDR